MRLSFLARGETLRALACFERLNLALCINFAGNFTVPIVVPTATNNKYVYDVPSRSHI
ncbi:hypothetical protein X777_03172 [Ooceraea biroi]|uniref:Uncharacterized protein n=1 Tax=Ooceraea biroi TaxID=2015173 RepID=A0A026WLZ4_OOCBI|nr:hypothetical protein X777_03172 [Ooceraea biroi]